MILPVQANKSSEYSGSGTNSDVVSRENVAVDRPSVLNQYSARGIANTAIGVVCEGCSLHNRYIKCFCWLNASAIV